MKDATNVKSNICLFGLRTEVCGIHTLPTPPPPSLLMKPSPLEKFYVSLVSSTQLIGILFTNCIVNACDLFSHSIIIPLTYYICETHLTLIELYDMK